MEKTNHDISRRSNINHKHLSGGGEAVIYEDHRTIINVLYHLFQVKKYGEPLDLIMFDNHDDFCHVDDSIVDILTDFLKDPSQEKLNNIVEFKLASLDDNWVTAGMELDLINNVFLFNSDETHVRIKKKYQTRNFGTKTLYNMSDVWSALSHRGTLNDPIKQDYKSLCEDFGWVLSDGKYEFKTNRKPFVFDIDLDCFSTVVLDETIAIPEEILIPKLTEFLNPSYHHYMSAQSFMKKLINESELVTLCFENGCCGGIRESHKIFNMVDYVLFDNELGE